MTSLIEDDIIFLESPFQDFGLDSLLSERIFAYLNGIDLLVCVRVSLAWRSFIGGLMNSRRSGRMIHQKIDQTFHYKWFEDKFKSKEVYR